MYRNEGLYEETPNLTLCIGNATFFMVALVLPSISINQSHKLDEESMATNKKCTELVESVLISLDYIYHGLSFITNIIIVLVRCLMILFTVMVGVVWDTKNKKKKQKSGGNEEGKIHDNNDQPLKLLANVCTAHKRYLLG